MPVVTRTFLKTALIHFVAALTAGVLVAARPMLDLPQFVAGLTPVYFHLFMVGWVAQLIIGVAYWMFPKYTRAQPRGSEMLAWATYALLNVGLILRVIGEPARAVSTSETWGWVLAVSALLQWLGGMTFVANTWPRVKEK